MTVTKADLRKELFLKLGLSHEEAKKGVRVVLEAIAEALRNGEDVQINGFGVFEVRERAARMGRNPRTGAPVPIPPTRIVVFRAADALADALRKD